MSTIAIRVDSEVHAALNRRRLPEERNYNEAILRATEQAELEDRLNRTGLSSMDMGRLHDLRITDA